MAAERQPSRRREHRGGRSRRGGPGGRDDRRRAEPRGRDEHQRAEPRGRDEHQRAEPRAFWSGTLSFGLVSVPVDLYPAVRPERVPVRMLGPNGHPLARRYVCPADGKPLAADDILRGYSLGDGRFVVVTDDELAALAPEKSRDIDLRRFVDRAALDPRLLERPYLLAPAGESTKAYHLLAEVMERRGRAGIATFVMRGSEYLAAIFAEGGVLRAATLRFADELRTPEQVGLPEPRPAPAKRRRQVAAALDALARDELDETLLRDEDAARLCALAEGKRAAARDVVEVPELPAAPEEEQAEQVIDIMSVLKQRIGAADAAAPRTRPARGSAAAPRTRPARGSAAAPRTRPDRGNDPLAQASKKDLYRRARSLRIPGRSRMSKQQLIRAIRARG